MSQVRLKTRRATVSKVRGAKYKVKTASSVAKRFSLTGTGRVKMTQCGKRHNMRKRSRRQLNNQTGCVVVDGNTMAILLAKRAHLI